MSSSYSLSNVLLPAVFVSSVVFSALTVPFALIKSEPVVIEMPPFYSGEIQPIFDGEHKDVAIPYVGFSIVVSVGAGMACVEVHRRWHAARAFEQESESLPDVQPTSLGEAQTEALNQPEYRPEVSAIEFSAKDEDFNYQPTTPDALTEAVDIAIEESEHAFEATGLGVPLWLPDTSQASAFDIPQNASATSSNQFNVSLAEETQSVPQNNAPTCSISSQEPDFAFNVLESPRQYKTCRIKVPHLERRLFAIFVEGQYYSFFRAESTHEKVLTIQALLGHRSEKTVITKSEKGYVIWDLEPEVSSTIS